MCVGPKRCDLSAGIETDARARTIAVHLTRPDEEFLHKLTLQFAYVVPADTPRRPTGERALPGTGPYRFESWDAERGGHLVRNPRFRSWSPARPAGFADRIEVSSAQARRPGTGRRRPERDRRPDGPRRARSGRGSRRQRFGALEVRSPGQLHSYPEAALNFMFLDVAGRRSTTPAYAKP